jgi:hypothetical protein
MAIGAEVAPDFEAMHPCWRSLPHHCHAPRIAPMNRFARRVYTIAGVYGLIVMLPQYFLFDRIGRDDPPAITHPEYFYGFVGIVIAWQIAFLVIARAPERYRALMPVTVLEKLVFAVPVVILFAQGRVAPTAVFFAGIDLVLGALFLAAWRETR